jgi:hypothetical protein
MVGPRAVICGCRAQGIGSRGWRVGVAAHTLGSPRITIARAPPARPEPTTPQPRTPKAFAPLAAAVLEPKLGGDVARLQGMVAEVRRPARIAAFDRDRL